MRIHTVSNHGFSFIELVLVIVMIVTLSAVAVPRYANASARYHIEAAAYRVRNDLIRARDLAIQTSASCVIDFGTDGIGYTVSPQSKRITEGLAYKVSISDAPYNARISLTNLGGDRRLLFNGFGRPDASGSIEVSVGSMKRTINISIDGAITIQ